MSEQAACLKQTLLPKCVGETHCWVARTRIILSKTARRLLCCTRQSVDSAACASTTSTWACARNWVTCTGAVRPMSSWTTSPKRPSSKCVVCNGRRVVCDGRRVGWIKCHPCAGVKSSHWELYQSAEWNSPKQVEIDRGWTSHCWW